MSPRFDVVTFDCYGTLVDWEGGIADAFAREAESEGRTLESSRVVTAYHEVEPSVEALEYRPYRDVLAETATRVARRLGWALPSHRAGFLADSLPDWRPFPDTNGGLSELAAAGHRLGILSNVDDDLLEGTRLQLAVSFDPVVTAQDVRDYKPAHAHFLEARRRIGDRRWLHAAQSWFHDVTPASALGIPVAWINRKGEPRPDGPTPEVEVRDLSRLAEWLRSGEN